MNSTDVLRGAIFSLETAGFYLARGVSEFKARAYPSACVLGTIGAEHTGLFFLLYGKWKAAAGADVDVSELKIDDHRKKIKMGLITVETCLSARFGLDMDSIQHRMNFRQLRRKLAI